MLLARLEDSSSSHEAAPSAAQTNRYSQGAARPTSQASQNVRSATRCRRKERWGGGWRGWGEDEKHNTRLREEKKKKVDDNNRGTGGNTETRVLKSRR